MRGRRRLYGREKGARYSSYTLEKRGKAIEGIERGKG